MKKSFWNSFNIETGEGREGEGDKSSFFPKRVQHFSKRLSESRLLQKSF